MSLFDRIAGTAEPKIPIWPFMMDVTRTLDTEITIQQLAEIHELTEAEVAEAIEYIAHIGGLVQSRAALLIKAWQIGTRQDLTAEEIEALTAHAVLDARGTVDNQLRYGLLRAETGKIDEPTFRANLGMS